MSELEHLTNIILTILSKDNQARNESEAYLQELQVKDLDQYTLAFVQLLNGIIAFQNFYTSHFSLSFLTLPNFLYKRNQEGKNIYTSLHLFIVSQPNTSPNRITKKRRKNILCTSFEKIVIKFRTRFRRVRLVQT